MLKAAEPQQTPQQQLAALARPPAEVDVVVSGGALRGYFMLGARHAIESRKDLKVVRYSGTSAGAWAACFMAVGLPSSEWLRTYTLTQAVTQGAKAQGKAPPALMEAYRERLWPWLQTVLPPDAHRRCSGRLFVTISTLTRTGPRPLVVSHFDSNQELFEACIASASLPMVTQRGFGSRFQGRRGFDGLFTENVPAFTDGARPQLVFDLGKVQYSLGAIIQPSDPCIEALAVSGALLTSRFLDGRRAHDPKAEVCSWRGWTGQPYPNHELPADGPLMRLAAQFKGRQLPQLRLPQLVLPWERPLRKVLGGSTDPLTG
jgi:predicted acylesterase/phospholipase RssA